MLELEMKSNVMAFVRFYLVALAVALVLGNVDYELAKVFKRLTDHGLKLELTEQAKEFLIDKGYNPEFGARPLRRAIEHYIEDPLSEAVLRGEFKNKTLVKINVQDEEHLKLKGVKTSEPSDKKEAVAPSQ